MLLENREVHCAPLEKRPAVLLTRLFASMPPAAVEKIVASTACVRVTVSFEPG